MPDPQTYAISIADPDPSKGARIIPIAPDAKALRDRSGRFSNKAIVLDEGLDPNRIESWRAMDCADALAHPGGLSGLCADIAWSLVDHPSLQRYARVFVADAMNERRPDRSRVGPDCLAIALDGEANLIGPPFAKPGRSTGLAPRGKGVICRIATAGSPSGIFLATPSKADARHAGGAESGGDITITVRLLRAATERDIVADGQAMKAVMAAAAALDERDEKRGSRGQYAWTAIASRVIAALDAETSKLMALPKESAGQS